MTIDTAAPAAQTPRAIPADTFANRLILARAQAGHLSIREAAALCDLGRGAWTNWEKGAKPEGLDDLADLIAEKLSCDRDWLRYGGMLRTVVDDRPRPRWSRRADTSPYSNRSGRRWRRRMVPRTTSNGRKTTTLAHALIAA